MKSVVIALAFAALTGCAQVQVKHTSLRVGTAALTDNAPPEWEGDPRRGDYPYNHPGF